MEKVIIVFFIFFTFFLFIYFKLAYSIIIIVFFSLEYIFFINFFYMFKSYQKSYNYSCLKINNINLGKASIFTLWSGYCEILAYKRLYLLALKPKLTINDFLKSLIVIIFGIPIKVIKISWFFIKSDKNLHHTLSHFFFFNYESVKNLKIEFINKKVFLNGSVRKNIISKIFLYNPDINVNECFLIYRELEKKNKIFNLFEEKLKESSICFLGSLTTEEGTKIPKNHWSHENSFEIKKNGDYIKTIIHATSNVPETLDNSQLTACGIKNLIKPGSNKPGSVITEGNYLFRSIEYQKKIIPSWQLEYITYSVYGPTSLSNNNEYFKEKDLIYSEILNTPVNTDIHNFSSGMYDIPLQSEINDKDLLIEIRNFKNNWLND